MRASITNFPPKRITLIPYDLRGKIRLRVISEEGHHVSE
jgi:hypothetical protein